MKRLIILSLLFMICCSTFAQNKATVTDSVKFVYCNVKIKDYTLNLSHKPSGWWIGVDYGEGYKTIDTVILKKYCDYWPKIKVANYFGERGWELINIISGEDLTYTFKKKK